MSHNPGTNVPLMQNLTETWFVVVFAIEIRDGDHERPGKIVVPVQIQNTVQVIHGPGEVSLSSVD